MQEQMYSKTYNLNESKEIQSVGMGAHRVIEREVSQLGQNLKRLREAAGFSQAALTKKAGLSRGVVAKLETGAADNCELLSLQALARALDCKVEDLTGESEQHVAIDQLLEEFRKSDTGKGVELSPEELEWLHKASDSFWRDLRPTPLAFYHFLMALRASKPATR